MEILSEISFRNDFAPIFDEANYFGVRGADMIQVYSEERPLGMTAIPDGTNKFELNEKCYVDEKVYSRVARAICPNGKHLEHRCLA